MELKIGSPKLPANILCVIWGQRLLCVFSIAIVDVGNTMMLYVYQNPIV